MIDQWNSIVTSNGNKLLKTSYLIDKWLTSQSMNAKDTAKKSCISYYPLHWSSGIINFLRLWNLSSKLSETKIKNVFDG